ncbi:MAG: ABC transporter ATP-binding protein [Bryobacteraceae bacterium]
MTHDTGALRRTLELIRSERGGLAVAVVYSIATGVLSLALPVAVQALVNTVAFGAVLQPVAVLTILVTAALTISALLTVLRSIVLERVQQRIFARQASEVLDSLLRFRVEALDREHAPELVNRFLDVATVQKSASILVVDGLTLVMQTLAGVMLLAAYHPYLLVFDFGLVGAIVFVIAVLGRGAVRTSIEESRSKYEVLAWLEEVARHSVTLRSRTGSRMAVDRANQLVLGYLANRRRHFRVLLRQIAGTQLLQAVALASLLGIGGYLVIAGELTLGQLVAAELVVSLAVGSFAKFGKSLETFYDLQAALDKLSHLTDLPLEPSGDARPAASQNAPAALQVSGLSFSYPDSAPVLSNASFSAPSASKVAVHGRNAAGKSTLLDLLFGLRDPSHGSIELNGLDYRHLPLEDLRSDVMLIRGPEIFPGTIAENIALGLPASTDQIRDALQQAGLLDAVLALPQGWDTMLVPSGRPLASTQAMRLSFARAIFQKPKLLLVDETLDSIDDLRLDGHLVRALFDPEAPWTLVAATERAELWPLFDRVYGLSGGTLLDDASTAQQEQA